MKTTSPAAATALATLYAKEKVLVGQSFHHLTSKSLQALDDRLLQEYHQLKPIDIDTKESRKPTLSKKKEECHLALAQACIRYNAHRILDKFAKLHFSRREVEDALKFHTLPLDLQEKLTKLYGVNSDDTNELQPPQTTWYEALEQLKAMATTAGGDGKELLDRGKLWRLILDHPITAYVPVQCQSCGHVVPDQYPTRQTDAEVGLEEVPATENELELRGGWFRGPRKAVVFQLSCPACQHVSRWYRSGHPQIILNPHRWGRLCGEQEDLRLILSQYLEIPVRLAVPLDWDHIWSEYLAPAEDAQTATESLAWQIQDGSARNFCCRLDEGIRSWTHVWTIHSNVQWCQDVTRDYLACQKDGGRADDHIGDDDLKRYIGLVRTAREDALGELTQAKTVKGYVLARAKLSGEDITSELQRAAQEYGTKEWWQL